MVAQSGDAGAVRRLLTKLMPDEVLRVHPELIKTDRNVTRPQGLSVICGL